MSDIRTPDDEVKRYIDAAPAGHFIVMQRVRRRDGMQWEVYHMLNSDSPRHAYGTGRTLASAIALSREEVA